MTKPSTILVTGAGGYIGSVLVPKLLAAGYHVRVLDRFFFGRDKLPTDAHLEIIKEDARHLSPTHLKNVEAVIDLVAMSNDPSGELFQKATWQINHQARATCAKLAKEAGVARYILPSSCSIYGFHESHVVVDEKSPTNPLTTYAKANEAAEKDCLKLACDKFCVVVMRQATVFGSSPRMRFDLAVNGMVIGAVTTGKIPLLRDGTQYRPFVHIQDTTDVMLELLTTDTQKINGEIFNVGSDDNNYQLDALAREVQAALPVNVAIEFYGEPDHRSYRVNFSKIEKTLGWHAKRRAKDGAIEIYEKIKSGVLSKTPQTITLSWYQGLIKWQQTLADPKNQVTPDERKIWEPIIKEAVMYGGVVEI